MKIRIYVTKKDILTGVKANCNHCPVALALKRRIKSDLYVEVKASCINISDVYILNDLNVYQFINYFDGCPRKNMDTIKPIRFMIEIPSDYLKGK